MDHKNKLSRLYFPLLAIAAIAAFVVLTAREISSFSLYWSETLLATSLVVWLTHFRMKFAQYQVTLIHVLVLPLGLSVGISPTLVSLTAGLLLYAVLDLVRHQRLLAARVEGRRYLQNWVETWSRQVLATGLGLRLYFVLGGRSATTSNSLPDFWPFIATIVGFSSIYLFTHWIHPQKAGIFQANRREALRLIIIALAPAPVVLLAASAYAYLGVASFILFALILAVTAPILSSLISMEIKLRQRANHLALLSDLSSLNISSHDPGHVAELILSTAISIGCGDQAILQFQQPDSGEMHLYTSDDFAEALKTFWQAEGKNLISMTGASFDTEPVLVASMQSELLEEESRASLLSMGILSFTSLQVHTSQSHLGWLTIFASQRVHYTPRRIELLKLFMSQAAFVLSNALAHATADVAISLQADQLSRLEDINRQLVTSTAADNLHEIILDHAIQASAAHGGYLALWRPETGKLHFVAHTASENYGRKGGQELLFDRSAGIFGRAFTTGQILNIADLTEESAAVNPLNSTASSVLCIPLVGPEDILGVLGVESQRSEAFTSSHEQFLTQLAAYAANAIHHAEIYNELQIRLTEQSLLYQASTQIAESLESDAVGLAIADSLRVTCQATAVSVFYWTEDDKSLKLVSRIDEGRPSRDPHPPTPDVTTLLGHAQCIMDRVSMQWSSTEEVSEAEMEYLLQNYGAGRILLLPLSVGARTLGLVEVFRAHLTPFSEAAIRSAQSIAIQATIALDNTILFQKISESHNRLEAILNSTREGILLVDTEGIISIANAQMEALIGVNFQDILNQPLEDSDLGLAPRLGYSAGNLEQLVESLRRGQSQLAGTATYERPDDPSKTLFRIDTPVYDPMQQLIGWLISIRDISEQREVEDTREQLTEMIVHDLRSPLTAILNSIVLLRRELKDLGLSTAVEQAFTVADRSVNQMLGLVNSLLDISRLESGKMKITTDEVDITQLMAELQERFQLEANSIGIILQPEFEASATRAHFDREKIQRVLANLLDNALKFTPAGGVIGFGYKLNAKQVTFWVSDTGPGIPVEFHQKIFERYIQIPGSPGRRRGTGIGLAFARLAVEAHGGNLWVEDNPDGGSIFKFHLPS